MKILLKKQLPDLKIKITVILNKSKEHLNAILGIDAYATKNWDHWLKIFRGIGNRPIVIR